MTNLTSFGLITYYYWVGLLPGMFEVLCISVERSGLGSLMLNVELKLEFSRALPSLLVTSIIPTTSIPEHYNYYHHKLSSPPKKEDAMQRPPSLFYRDAPSRIPGLNIDFGLPSTAKTAPPLKIRLQHHPRPHLASYLPSKSRPVVCNAKTSNHPIQTSSQLLLSWLTRFVYLDSWDKSVVILFVLSLVLLVRALGAFGHSEMSCGLCALEKTGSASDVPVESSKWVTDGGAAEDQEEEEAFVEWQEFVDFDDDADELSRNELQGEDLPHRDFPTSYRISQDEQDGPHIRKDDDSELAFFRKHFNDRYDFIPLDAVNEVYEDD
jgi:hypothetical protein